MAEAKAAFPAQTRALVLTISDRCSRGEQQDLSGPAVATLLREAGLANIEAKTLPDDLNQIAAALQAAAGRGLQLIVTTGGTGLAARDITPEATRQVCDRLIDGVAERMRAAGLARTPRAALSRGICGTIGSTLVINVPGSPDGARTSLAAVLDIVPHALDLLAGRTEHEPQS